MNYEAMSDDEINYEVAKHSFDAGWLERHYGKEGMVPDYCNNWEDAGKVIFENRISISFDQDGIGTATGWSNGCAVGWCDKNPLLAAMVVFLMMKDVQK